MRVLLLEPWGWRLSLYISKVDSVVHHACEKSTYCFSVALTCPCASCRYSGVLSAYGLALADVVEEVQEPCSLQYDQSCFRELDRRVGQLSKRCHDTLCARGFDRWATTEHRVNHPLIYHTFTFLFTRSHQTKAVCFLSSPAVRPPLRFSSTCVIRAPTVRSWLPLPVTPAMPSPVALETSTVPSLNG